MLPEKALDLLRKLVKHQQSAAGMGSVHEAEAFANRIQVLLNEYKLSMTDVEFAEREASEPFGAVPVIKGFPIAAQRTRWQTMLANGIAKANECEVVWDGNGSNRLFFIGRTSNREMAKELYVYFMNLADTLSEVCADNEKGQIKFDYINSLPPNMDWDVNSFNYIMRGWRAAWYEGFGRALAIRFFEKYAEMMAQATIATNQTAIVHLRKDEVEIEKYMDKFDFEKTENQGVEPKYVDRRGFASGISAAASIALTNKQVTGPQGPPPTKVDYREKNKKFIDSLQTYRGCMPGGVERSNDD